MQLKYSVPQNVFNAMLSLGRTEDLKFCPSNRRLAIAAFNKNKIVLFEMSVNNLSDQKNITLTDATEFSSERFAAPHGLDFIDDRTMIVANRDGDACILRLPPNREWGPRELDPIKVIPASEVLDRPGSVCVVQKGKNSYEALICNNYQNYVTRHLINFANGCVVEKSEVLLRKGLALPDGVCMSKDRQWIAISNHETQCVTIYENSCSLNERSDPVGFLRGANYPHGLRFTSDGNFILVADAGSPFVHIYASGSSWQGVHNPLTSLRVMSDEAFLHGRQNAQEGGPKGIDIDKTNEVIVTTCESQPLAFFELSKILT